MSEEISPEEPRDVFIANRGEVAIRIVRAARERGFTTSAIYSQDDRDSLHTRSADRALLIPGRGPAAYLATDALIECAVSAGCQLVHPGYGFLSETAAFARACERAGLGWIGPSPETLELFGDKPRARELAAELGIPTTPGTGAGTTLAEASSLLERVGTVVLKAVAGGGGRGIRVVRDADALPDAFARAQSEAEAASGNAELYAEGFVSRARHVEVQVAGDGVDVAVLGERDCSVQRRHQKLVEIAPCPWIDAALRRALFDAARTLCERARLRTLATVEFLVDEDARARGDAPSFYFIEVNPRLQVEHTVTEEVTGIDLVGLQFALADGTRLAELDLGDVLPRGVAIQARINTERVDSEGEVRPTGGTLVAFDPPSGPCVRVDSYGYAGYSTNPSFDSLLSKVIVSGTGFAAAAERLYRALCEFRIEGVETNLDYLKNILRHPSFLDGSATTTFLGEAAATLAAAFDHPTHFFVPDTATEEAGRAGARIDSADPLAVLAHGKSEGAASRPLDLGPEGEGLGVLRAPMQGTIVSVAVSVGDAVARGQSVIVMEAMKMEHLIEVDTPGRVTDIAVLPGDTVYEGHPLLRIEVSDEIDDFAREEQEVDLERIRPDLAEVFARHEKGLDPARPEAVARRRKTGQRTARENVADLCDAGSFVEYGSLMIAAQRKRRSLEDLIARTPADGLIGGIGCVNRELFGEEASRCIVMSYDYTVLAGTQGWQNHRKKDRLFELAEQWRAPLVLFTEGGGGRPGDTDGLSLAGLDCLAFQYFGRLSGLAPLVAINSGRCFAGNAALLGCCDVVIATENSSIGMGGPAMIEGGGLGVFHPDEVGPMSVQARNGVVDVLVRDEAEAVSVAKRYLGYFQGAHPSWDSADQRRLRAAIPENRLRVYDVRAVIELLADTDSVLELRRGFGAGMVTSLARLEGRPIGIIANNPKHLAGAIDSDGADKAARFMQLCDAFDIPLLFLCDTPGMMVGPEVEKTALVRHCSRLFVIGANLSVPFFTIVLRKGYGLGAQAMAGGSFKAPGFTVAWPTGEFGGMGLEGAVKLGYRKELEAETDPEKRNALFDEMVARMYEHGKALSMATAFEIDDVIDPAESRRWLLAGLQTAPPPGPRQGKKRPCVDTW
ncbi:MAG: ATP-grasp domain-containing protein [Myxococcales bacterium]|nr:ATP-grasp domain-containing protein [Myxococcales bacterium]